MAKSTRGDFLRCAGQALAQQNFPLVYKNAAAALALGAPEATYFLLACGRNEMARIAHVGGDQKTAGRIAIDFVIKYEVAASYQVKGFHEFTILYTTISSTPDMKHHTVKNLIASKVGGYRGYIETAKMQCSEGAAVDIRTADQMVGLMEQAVVQNVAHTVHSLQVSAPPPPPPAHGYDHHQPDQHSSLLGHEHSSKGCKDWCAIL
jgi:hypothetical protein